MRMQGSMGFISSLNNSYLQSVLSTALQSTGRTTNTTGSSSVTAQPDNGQLSPFAQLMSTLQHLQQTNPTGYKQVTSQIAANLTSAAQTAQSSGNTAAATQLTQLATDFTDASQNGQMPNIQDLAQALGGHRHHHHGGHAASSVSSSSSNTDSNSSSSASSQGLSQLLAAFEANGTQNESQSLNPMAIIMNTLSNAGIGQN
jgi:hypothetical protein